uniref:NADH-ubiquinone oxidoreductase chain 2 n=1 Tax=Galerucinae sp. 1 ACP-2013 TaxID=1434514 RepID=A0A3G3FX77_9CUCU|nr:NADH dehydrogenase subunit 2 [Galerucinae sp. 1 ACP-2013]
MSKFYKFMFLNTLILGTLIALTAYSWFSMWIGLEINLLSIIPLMKSGQNSYPAEAALKYFITQAFASIMVLFAIVLSLNLLDYPPNNSNFWQMMVLNSGLLTKLGAAPFHVWFPEVIEGLNWLTSMALLTIQKLAPMILIMYNWNMTLFFSSIIIMSSLVGGILGLNQTSLRKLMAYSSINHIAWMLASLFNFSKIWLDYFLIYCVITLNLIMIFQLNQIYKIPQLILMLNSNKLINFLFITNFMSLGGLPPFLGFTPKWLVINGLVENKFFSLSLILILSTLITLYFYLRITLSTLAISMSMVIIQSKKNEFFIIIINSLSLFGLILYTSIFSLY